MQAADGLATSASMSTTPVVVGGGRIGNALKVSNISQFTAPCVSIGTTESANAPRLLQEMGPPSTVLVGRNDEIPAGSGPIYVRNLRNPLDIFPSLIPFLITAHLAN